MTTVLTHERTERAPVVIPLHVTGCVDTNLASLTLEELQRSALQNAWQDGEEGAYLVRHGSRPIRDFGRPQPGALPVETVSEGNLFERAFPCLYPYGVGGIESDQSTPIDFADHVRWALQYHDRRFKHETFPFLTFGILQRRQALGSAHLQMRRPDFDRLVTTLEGIDASKLKQSSDKEA